MTEPGMVWADLLEACKLAVRVYDDDPSIDDWDEAMDRVRATIAKAPDLAAENARLRKALESCRVRAKPHPDDDDADRKRNLFHVVAIVDRALAHKETV